MGEVIKGNFKQVVRVASEVVEVEPRVKNVRLKLAHLHLSSASLHHIVGTNEELFVSEVFDSHPDRTPNGVMEEGEYRITVKALTSDNEVIPVLVMDAWGIGSLPTVVPDSIHPEADVRQAFRTLGYFGYMVINKLASDYRHMTASFDKEHREGIIKFTDMPGLTIRLKAYLTNDPVSTGLFD